MSQVEGLALSQSLSHVSLQQEILDVLTQFLESTQKYAFWELMHFNARLFEKGQSFCLHGLFLNEIGPKSKRGKP
jgi:hypothetical protein